MGSVGIIILLMFGITFISVLSNKFKFPFQIILVVSGIGIGLIPSFPTISLRPDIVFLIFLPPLLYGAAWNISWHEFKANKRPIALAGFGLVIFTTLIVGCVAHEMIPGMSWPLSFLLGAIVSPPDAVAATSITKGLGLQPRILSILEGESLVNDSSGLIAYKYAITAVMAGNFVLWQAGLDFLGVITGAAVIGLVIGHGMYLIHKKFICDPVIEVTLTLLTPYASYLLCEYFHLSGVIGVVTTGLYLSFRSDSIFSHQSRIMAYAVWDVVVFVLNSLIFVLIGLQLRSVMQGIQSYSATELILYGVAISVVTIIIRFVWVLPAALLPRWLSKRIRQTESFEPRNMVVFGWAGMRGVVSLAAALGIPLLLPDGSPFPMRDLIIYLAFCVILFTLVVLGLTLPWIIKKMKLEPHSIAAEEYEIRTSVVSKAIEHIETNLSLVRDELLNNIKNKYEIKYNRLQRTDLPANYFSQNKPAKQSVISSMNFLNYRST